MKLMLIPVLPICVLFVPACNQDANSPVGRANGADVTALQRRPGEVASYQITLENLTPGGSQPLSPPVVATHAPSFQLFHLGGYASDELSMVAEDAVNGPLVSLLNSSSEVHAVETGSGPIPPGGSATLTIDAAGGFHMLSLVSMLMNTNDAFTSVNKIALPVKGSKVFYLRAYDAGSEENTELAANIPGPCCGNGGVRVPTHERIRFHPGILGTGDKNELGRQIWKK